MIEIFISVRGGPPRDYSADPTILSILNAVVPPTAFTFRDGDGVDEPVIIEDTRTFEAEAYSFAGSDVEGVEIESVTVSGTLQSLGATTQLLAGTINQIGLILPNGERISLGASQSDGSFGIPLTPGQSFGDAITAAGGLGSVSFAVGVDDDVPVKFDGIETDDFIRGGRGEDVLAGGTGRDYIQSVATDDIPSFPGGETKNDQLFAGERFDRQDAFGLTFAVERDLTEDTPINFLVGGPGDDDLFGVSQQEHSIDFLIGGPGADHFYVDNGDVIEEWGQYVPDIDTQQALDDGEVIDFYIFEKNIDQLSVNVVVDPVENEIAITPFNAVSISDPADTENGMLGAFAIEKGNLNEALFDVSVIPLTGNTEGNVEAVLRFKYGEIGNFNAPSLAERIAELASFASLQKRVIDEGQAKVDKAVVAFTRTATENLSNKLAGDDFEPIVSRLVLEQLLPQTLSESLLAEKIAESMAQDDNILEGFAAFNNVFGRTFTDLLDPYIAPIKDPANYEAGASVPLTLAEALTEAQTRAGDAAEEFIKLDTLGSITLEGVRLGSELIAATLVASAELTWNTQIFERQRIEFVVDVPIEETGVVNEVGGESYFESAGSSTGTQSQSQFDLLGALGFGTASPLTSAQASASNLTPLGTSGRDRVYSQGDFDLQDTIVEDLIHVGDGSVALIGNDLDNIIVSDGVDDEIYGLGGNDSMAGGFGEDLMDGGEGDDTATYIGAVAGVSASLLSGQGFAGEALGDIFVSVENLIGSAFDDILNGDDQGNRLIGDLGADILNGGGAADNLNGGAGSDTLRGDEGDDSLDGGIGNDIIDGGAGNDILRGGTGDDVFIKRPGESDDIIFDFEQGEDGGKGDKVDVSAYGFSFSQLIFERIGEDLRLNLGADSLLFKNFTGITLNESDFIGLTLENNDFPAVDLSLSTNSGSETAGNVVSLNVVTTGGTVSGDQTVGLDISGLGITSSDYELSSSTVTILDGQTQGTATLTILDDNDIEGSENLTISLIYPSAGLVPGTNTSQILAIADNDFPNSPPTTTGISDINAIENDPALIIDLFAAFDDSEDPDADLTYTLSNNSNPELLNTNIDPVTSELTLTFLTDQSGASQLTVVATDTGDQTVSSNFSVTVAPFDANNDGIADGTQSNIIPVATPNEDFVTFVADSEQPLPTITAIENPAPATAPPELEFDQGFYDFNFNGLTPGEATVVTLYLPEGSNVNSYWKYGPLTLGGANEWYEFSFDPVTQTGAQFQDLNGDGQKEVLLYFVDGQRGDDDLTVNGIIDDPGAPAFDPAVSNSPPTLNNPIADQLLLVGQPFTYIVPTDTFSDADGEPLELSLAPNTSLPDGISFDDDTGLFFGTPTTLGSETITLIATDSASESTEDSFLLAVYNPIPIPSRTSRITGTNQNDYFDASGSNSRHRHNGLDGDDIILGSDGREVFLGGEGDDILLGNGGIDKLFGQKGNDLLDGGAGIDLLFGGDDADTFVLREGDGTDRIRDFVLAEGDRFALDNIEFGALTFIDNEIHLGNEVLAKVFDGSGGIVTDFEQSWFTSI